MILLRSAAFAIWFYGVTTLFCLGSPLPRWRARRHGRIVVHAYARAWARTVLAGLRILCGTDWQLEGAANLPAPGTPAILAAQHQSTFETLFWTIPLTDVAFVVKRELFAIPLFGGLLQAGGMIPVDRQAGASALRTLLRAASTAAAESRTILIFPEGTRSAAGEVGTLRPGLALIAERTGLPIIPVVTDAGRFWGRLQFIKHPGTIRIAVLPALPRGLSRPAMMQLLHDTFVAGKPVENSVDQLPDPLPRDWKPSS